MGSGREDVQIRAFVLFGSFVLVAGVVVTFLLTFGLTDPLVDLMLESKFLALVVSEDLLDPGLVPLPAIPNADQVASDVRSFEQPGLSQPSVRRAFAFLQ